MISVALASVLGVVLVYAGLVKLLRRDDVPAMFARLAPWLPARLHRSSALLPVVEVCLGLALLLAPQALWASAASLALLLAFSTVVGVAVVQRRAVSCACFGATSRSNIGNSTLARNIGLCLICAELVRQSIVSDNTTLATVGERWGSLLAACAALALLPLLVEIVTFNRGASRIQLGSVRL